MMQVSVLDMHKLVDCRQLRQLPQTAGKMENISYSLCYTAPEVVAALAAGQKQIRADPAVDVWALGVIAYAPSCYALICCTWHVRNACFLSLTPRPICMRSNSYVHAARNGNQCAQ